MKARISLFLSSEFFQSSFYSGISTLIKIATAFLMGKILAIYLGPEGMGLVGQLTSFITIALILAGGALNNGIVKYIAEYRNNSPEKIPALLSTSLKVGIFSSAIVALALILFSNSFSEYIFISKKYGFVFVIFGGTIIFYTINVLIQAILNGHKSYRKFNIISITLSLGSLLISFLLISQYSIKGALISLVSSQAILAILVLYLVRSEQWFSKVNFKLPIYSKEFRKLSGYMLMALISAICIPISQMYMRGYIIDKFSLSEAGLWESVNRISSTYLLFVTTTLATYYLPKLSELRTAIELKKEMFKVYKLVLPVVILVSTCIYFFRDFIIQLLFTRDFYGASDLFLFQMIGDVLKIASWLLAVRMIAKAMIKSFIITEVLFAISFVLLSIYGLDNYGLVGITIAYAVNYLVYLIVMLVLFRGMFKNYATA